MRARVTAPYVTVKMADPEGSVTVRGFYAGGIIDNGDRADVERLIGKGMLEEIEEISEPQPDPDSFTVSDLVGLSVKEILDRVGDDPEAAAAVLEAEQARGDKTRSTLVESLTAILDAATS